MPKKPAATLGIIYRMPLEDLHPHPLNPYGVRDLFRQSPDPERKVDTN